MFKYLPCRFFLPTARHRLPLFPRIAATAVLVAVLGFFCWNWPSGRIFLGDGGAYLIGFWLAEMGVLLVVRNPEVSPWFPLLLMIYPVWETLYSMYRRWQLHGEKVAIPDARHFHQLVHRSIALQHIANTANPVNSSTNHKVLIRLLPWLITPTLIAAVTWSSTWELAFFVITFCALYVWCYRRQLTRCITQISAQSAS